MLLSEYCSSLTKVIDEYSKTNFITNSNINTDFRTEKIGVIEGTITFLDESKLFFTEYVDLKYKIERLSYSFHYQQKNGTMVFRYDNAYHKPKLTFSDHKHLSNGDIIESEITELGKIIEEIIDIML